jgi:hypothetical protein
MTTTDTTTPQEGEAPTLTVDGVSYAFAELSERVQGLSLDFIRTEQEWQQLQHRYRQFVAMEATVVNSLKQEVEQAALEPVWSSGDLSSSETPFLSIDDRSYDASSLPDNVRLYVDDLVRNNQERRELEFRLRQLDAARLGYLGVIREELSGQA